MAAAARTTPARSPSMVPSGMRGVVHEGRSGGSYGLNLLTGGTTFGVRGSRTTHGRRWFQEEFIGGPPLECPVAAWKLVQAPRAGTIRRVTAASSRVR